MHTHTQNTRAELPEPKILRTPIHLLAAFNDKLIRPAAEQHTTDQQHQLCCCSNTLSIPKVCHIHRKQRGKKKVDFFFVRCCLDFIKNVFTHQRYKSVASFRMRRHSAFCVSEGQIYFLLKKYTTCSRMHVCVLHDHPAWFILHTCIYGWIYMSLRSCFESISLFSLCVCKSILYIAVCGRVVE